MVTITLSKKDIYQGNLVVVNAKHPMATTFCVENVILLPYTNHQEAIALEKKVYTILYTLLEDIQGLGKITFVSGYRSYEEQKNIWDQTLRTHGEAFTRQYVAYPQTSEHQTGLAIDVGISQETIDFIRPDFPSVGISQIFREKANAYGFIERYPKDKEMITGIAYEPWHFRYVGHPHAQIIKEKHFCLEEYIEYIKQFSQSNPYIYEDKKIAIEIFYIPYQEEQKLVVSQHQIYQISGNNIDGFIITVWRNQNGR